MKIDLQYTIGKKYNAKRESPKQRLQSLKRSKLKTQDVFYKKTHLLLKNEINKCRGKNWKRSQGFSVFAEDRRKDKIKVSSKGQTIKSENNRK